MAMSSKLLELNGKVRRLVLGVAFLIILPDLVMNWQYKHCLLQVFFLLSYRFFQRLCNFTEELTVFQIFVKIYV
jgi:hypothetical protein